MHGDNCFECAQKKRNKLEIRQTSRLFCWNSLAHAKWAYVYKWFISLLLPVRAGARCTLTYLSVNSQVLFIYSRFYINQIYHHNVFVVGTHWIFSEHTQWMKSCDCVGEETAKAWRKRQKTFFTVIAGNSHKNVHLFTRRQSHFAFYYYIYDFPDRCLFVSSGE